MAEKTDLDIQEGGVETLRGCHALWTEFVEHQTRRAGRAGPALARLFDGMWDADLARIASEGELHVQVARYVPAAPGASIPDDTLVGFCITSVGDAGRGEVEVLFVRRAYRGTGVGRRMFERALQWLEDRGVEEQTLGVVAGNESVVPFYEAYGFVPAYTMYVRAKPPHARNRPAGDTPS